MRTVHAVSQLTGVSVRTLHHYDAIGLLKPSQVTAAGYRLYDEEALSRLQSILLFRELQFPLKEIKALLDIPGFDPREALEQQIGLLELQKKRLEKLIALARDIQNKGVHAMTFDAFDRRELDRYKEEAREKWGRTAAYQEYEQKKDKNADEASKQWMALFAELGALKHLPPADQAVQDKIAALRQFISDTFYTCTPQILQSLGDMYESDQRFRQNIDRAGGEGTAAFVQQAIAAYCSSR